VAKTYTCNITSPSVLLTTIVPSSLLLQCRTGLDTSSTPAAPGGGLAAAMASSVPEPTAAPGNCSIRFVVKSSGAPVECNLAGCVINPNSSAVACSEIVCGCPSGSCGSRECLAAPRRAPRASPCRSRSRRASHAPDQALRAPPAALVTGLTSSAKGKSTLDCTAEGSCVVKISGLPVASIDAQCQATECLVPSAKQLLNTTEGALLRRPRGPAGSIVCTQRGAASPAGKAPTALAPPLCFPSSTSPAVVSIDNLNINPVIAAIPTMVLTLLLIFAGGYALSNRKLWQVCLNVFLAPSVHRGAARLLAATTHA
jgi:hypothetical protein